MRLWRISNHADLSGEGGLRASGRWHTKGRRVVYLADHPASALIEIMVHLEIDAQDLPSRYQLLGIDVPDEIAIARADTLPETWREQTALTREQGDAWLRGGDTALLQVPSSIVPDTSNYLFNPAHADAAGISIASAVRAAFDPRLMIFVKS
jgi:RES domain-containing protein